MPDNILDYIETIQESDSEGVCFTSSDTIWIEGSTNEFKSSEAEFLCWSPGDYFIVWGTDYNDGVYEKANDVDPYVLQAKSPISGETVNLVTENCYGKIIAINEVCAIGQGSAVVPMLNVAPSEWYYHGLVGEIGDGSATLPALQIDARKEQGFCFLPSLEIEAYGASHGDASLPALTADVTGASGNQATTSLPAITAAGELSRDVFAGRADLYLSVPWISATSGYVRKSFWASAKLTLPTLVGGKFSDASAELPPLTAQAERYLPIEGKCYLPALEIRGYSAAGNVGFARISSLQASASGSSGIQGTLKLPSLQAKVATGAWAYFGLPTFTAYGKDDSWPSFNRGDADIELPSLEATGSYDKPITESGDGQLTLKVLTVSAYALVEVIASGKAKIRPFYATGCAVSGVLGQGAISFPNIQMDGEASVPYVGKADVALEAISMVARIYIESSKYPVLSYQDEGDDYSWQIW